MRKLYRKMSVFFIKLFKRSERGKYASSEPQTSVGHDWQVTYYDYNPGSHIAARSRSQTLENKISQEKSALYAKGASPSELAAYESQATGERMEIRKKYNYWTPHQ